MDQIPDSGFSLRSLPLFAIHADLFTVCLSHMHCVKLFKLPSPSTPQAAWKELNFHTRGSVVSILLSFSSCFSPPLVFFYIGTHLRARSHVPHSSSHPLSGSAPVRVSPFPNTISCGKTIISHPALRHAWNLLTYSGGRKKHKWSSYQKNTSQKW